MWGLGGRLIDENMLLVTLTNVLDLKQNTVLYKLYNRRSKLLEF